MTIRIIGGAPPAAGPAQLRYRQGETIRLNVTSDTTLEVRLTGYGVTRTIEAGRPTEIDVKASRSGSFAPIVADSHIAAAQMAVSRR